MQFSNKLNFLMNITNTSNKELAEGISVDRSLISLLRSGKRKTPRNHDHVRHMASFFARRCTADFQFHALAEMLNTPEIQSSLPTETLVDDLFNWMLGDTPMLEHILENVAHPQNPLNNIPDHIPTRLSAPTDGQTNFFYGNEGMRQSLRLVLDHVMQIEEPCKIYLVSDLNMEWLFEDYRFMNEFSSALTSIFQKGFSLCHIMPSLNYMNRYVEALRYWLPLYASGQAEVYYYPRLRDNLYRRSLAIFPGHCVQASTNIGNASNVICVNSTEKSLIDAYYAQFQYELSLCRPALISHSDPLEYVPCSHELLKSPGNMIQMITKPSPYTMPRACIDSFINDATYLPCVETLKMHRDDAALFEEKLSHSICIELCPLSSPADIRAGNVLVGMDYSTHEHHPVYTPEIYAGHLQHILELMDKYENYYFIPIEPKHPQTYNLFAGESGLSLLVSNLSPFFMMKIRRPELSVACYEYLMRMADLVGYTGIRRTKIRIQLTELIQELLS